MWSGLFRGFRLRSLGRLTPTEPDLLRFESLLPRRATGFVEPLGFGRLRRSGFACILLPPEGNRIGRYPNGLCTWL